MYYGQPGGGHYQTMSGPAPARPRPTKPRIYKIFIIFAIIVIILLGLSLALPWYTESSDGEAYVNYSFGGIEDVDDSEVTPWDDISSLEAMKGVYNLTFILTIVSLILVILILIGTIAVLIFDIDKRIIILFSLLAFLFCILSPVVFAALHPGAVETDFKNIFQVEEIPVEGPWESFIGDQGDQGWGPGIGWYFAIISFILIIIIFIMSFKLPDPEPATITVQEQPMYPTMQMQPPQFQYGYPPPQQPYYPPPQQPYYPPQAPPQAPQQQPLPQPPQAPPQAPPPQAPPQPPQELQQQMQNSNPPQ
jgi:hypothetical protein